LCMGVKLSVFLELSEENGLRVSEENT